MPPITWKNMATGPSDVGSDLMRAGTNTASDALTGLAGTVGDYVEEDSRQNTDTLKNFIANQTLDTVGTDATRAELERLTQGKNNNFDQSVYRDGLDKRETALQSAFTADNAFNEKQQDILRKPYEEQFKSIVASEGLDKGLNYLNDNKEHFGGKVADMQKWGNDHQASTHAAEVAGLSRDYGTYAEEAKALYQKGDYPGGDALVEKYGDGFSKMGQTSILAAHREAQQDKDITDKENLAKSTENIEKIKLAQSNRVVTNSYNAVVNTLKSTAQQNIDLSLGKARTLVNSNPLMEGFELKNGTIVGLDEAVVANDLEGVSNVLTALTDARKNLPPEGSILDEFEAAWDPMNSLDTAIPGYQVDPQKKDDARTRFIEARLNGPGNSPEVTRAMESHNTKMSVDHAGITNNDHFIAEQIAQSPAMATLEAYQMGVKQGTGGDDDWWTNSNAEEFIDAIGDGAERTLFWELAYLSQSSGLPLPKGGTIKLTPNELKLIPGMVHSDFGEVRADVGVKEAFNRMVELAAQSKQYEQFQAYKKDQRGGLERIAKMGASSGSARLSSMITTVNQKVLQVEAALKDQDDGKPDTPAGGTPFITPPGTPDTSAGGSAVLEASSGEPGFSPNMEFTGQKYSSKGARKKLTPEYRKFLAAKRSYEAKQTLKKVVDAKHQRRLALLESKRTASVRRDRSFPQKKLP